MDTRKASKVSWKHVVCCIVLLVIFVLTIGIHLNAEGNADGVIADTTNTSDTLPLRTNNIGLAQSILDALKNEVEAGPKEEVTVNQVDIDYYITTYADELKFFANTFGVNYEDIIDDLHERFDVNCNKGFNETNIGFILNENGDIKTFESIEYGIVEYFYNYVKKNPKKVNNKREPYTGSAEYVENLIIYYTTHIYTNVDTKVALSIGAAESGYYKVKYMLRCNNVFGGMSSNGLIKYKNIEYGVLSYIRLLSKNYYNKGLNTISKIGRVYCPTYDNYGNKIASPHWINLVNTAINKYQKRELSISLEDLKKEI